MRTFATQTIAAVLLLSLAATGAGCGGTTADEVADVADEALAAIGGDEGPSEPDEPGEEPSGAQAFFLVLIADAMAASPDPLPAVEGHEAARPEDSRSSPDPIPAVPNVRPSDRDCEQQVEDRDGCEPKSPPPPKS